MPHMWCPWKYWLASQLLPFYVQETKKTSSLKKNLKDIKEYSYFWWKRSIECSTSLGPLSRELAKCFCLAELSAPQCRIPCEVCIQLGDCLHRVWQVGTQNAGRKKLVRKLVTQNARRIRIIACVCLWVCG